GSEKTTFPCEKWLAKSEEDGEIMRELVPSRIFTEKLMKDGTLKQIDEEIDDSLEIYSYKVSVFTGDIYGAGTDANVYLTIYGDLGDTGERKLRKSETNTNKFERGQIRHDNTLPRPDWYLEKVKILNDATDSVYLFECERWLSRKKEDLSIERILWEKNYDPDCLSVENSTLNRDHNANLKDKKTNSSALDGSLIPYHIVLTTGKEYDSSTSSRVFMIVIGLQENSTGHMWLDLPEEKTQFAACSVEKFSVMGID
ncbi:hypothetical protein E2320_017865, partial [Naja naja]